MLLARVDYDAQVLPAYAGMILCRQILIVDGRGAPRVCGDDPRASGLVHELWRCSPRMRG